MFLIQVSNESEELKEVNEEVETDEVDTEVSEEEKVITLNVDNKKKSYKQPSQKAKDYDEGDEVVSEFDGCKYVVAKDKRNRRRWKRVVESIS